MFHRKRISTADRKEVHLNHGLESPCVSLAQTAVDTLISGGIVTVPLRVGLGLLASSDATAEKIIAMKTRGPNKPLCVLADAQLALSWVEPEHAPLIRTLAASEIPVTILAPVRDGAPICSTASSKSAGRTVVAFYIEYSPLSAALNSEARRRSVVLVGSSANPSGAGNAFRWSELDATLRRGSTPIGEPYLVPDAPADAPARYGATIIDARTRAIVRVGAHSSALQTVLAENQSAVTR